MELIEELISILERRPDLPLYHRAVLKMAISFLDREGKSTYRRNQNWRVRLSPEEMKSLPGEYWEFVDGQPIVKE
jgi:hypothetical protein